MMELIGLIQAGALIITITILALITRVPKSS